MQDTPHIMPHPLPVNPCGYGQIEYPSCFFNFLLLNPAKPAKPEPNRSMVAGSGTPTGCSPDAHIQLSLMIVEPPIPYVAPLNRSSFPEDSMPICVPDVSIPTKAVAPEGAHVTCPRSSPAVSQAVKYIVPLRPPVRPNWVTAHIFSLLPIAIPDGLTPILPRIETKSTATCHKAAQRRRKSRFRSDD